MSDRLRLFPTLDTRAIATQLETWQGDYPQMGVLALVPEGERQRIVEIQAAFRARDARLVGAVFPRLLSEAGFHANGVILLRLDVMPPVLLVASLGSGEGEAEAGVAAFARSIQAKLQDDADTTLFMLFDALVPNIATILEGLYLRLADRVQYLGVNAGSESFKPIPCLFDGERIVQGGVLALLLQTPRFALEHGYRQPEQMVAATSTAGNRIISIDWRPAFDVYREQVKQYYGEEIDRENFYRLAVHFPFGIVRMDGEVLVRIPVALEEDGSLFCVGEVPANSILTLLQAPSADSLVTAQTLATRLQVRRDEDLLVFYCAGRRMHLGAAAGQELMALQKASASNHLAGALSLGEIGSARSGGYPLFHNATIVCMPV